MPWAGSPGSSPTVSVCSLCWDGYTQKGESIPREGVAKGLESRRTSWARGCVYATQRTAWSLQGMAREGFFSKKTQRPAPCPSHSVPLQQSQCRPVSILSAPLASGDKSSPRNAAAPGGSQSIYFSARRRLCTVVPIHGEAQ